ncbi:MAG: universal stress protein [Deltaproteobacteria bacterium]|nr:universal stress protein [Deltaproteobacteria bacterium]
MYQTILVPLDGSARAEHILPHAENLAIHYNAKVIFLQVMEPLQIANPSLHVTSALTDTIKESLKEFNRRYEEINTYLSGHLGEFKTKGIDVRKFVEQGPVVETIISVAQRENADLIAIASHGRSGMSRVFYGSVAAGVLQQIDRPMLIIRSRNI